MADEGVRDIFLCNEAILLFKKQDEKPLTHAQVNNPNETHLII